LRIWPSTTWFPHDCFLADFALAIKTPRVLAEDGSERGRWHHATFIACFVLPLLLSSVYTRVLVGPLLAGSHVSPLYPVVLGLALGLPPMLLAGSVLSWLIKRPRGLPARALLGLVLGALLFYGGTHGWFVF
jgi:hypothetical protein